MKQVCVALLLLVFTQAHARDAAQRTRVTVRCVEATGTSTRTLYNATVEGPHATDFELSLVDGGFELNATFINEPVATRQTDVRMNIASRRRAGTSRNGLQLWEEGVQQQRMRVGADEQLELLPFGGAGPRGTIRFEVVREEVAGDAAAPVTIAIGEQQTRAIRVRAYRVPHWYVVDATLTARDGRQVARGVARAFKGERTRVNIGNVAQLDVTSDAAPYQDAWRAAQVRFDGRWSDGKPLATSWEGITAGAPLQYELSNGMTLRIAVRAEES
ncbi:MAG TPA: hypothetical protein VE010_12360 [Thermoanaerobaculia bacterium]|nr:hypothetical protein [Thermoanaerobaculia bacterium]